MNRSKPLRGKKRTSRTAAETRAMREYREKHPVCESCRELPSDHTHHINTEKTGGPAEDWNFLALCVFCHDKVHTMGWKTFCDHRPHLAGKITAARLRMGRSLNK